MVLVALLDLEDMPVPNAHASSNTRAICVSICDSTVTINVLAVQSVMPIFGVHSAKYAEESKSISRHFVAQSALLLF